MNRLDKRAVNLSIDIAGVVVCLLLTAVVYFVGFKPMLDREADDMAQRDALRQQQQQLDQTTATLTVMRGNLVKFRHAIKESAIQLQSSANLNRRVGEITELASRCGLAVHEIQPGTISSGERYDTVPIQLGGQGTYQNCARFLSELHDAFPDTGVSSLEMTGNPSSPATPAMFRLALTWYAAPQIKAAVPATGPAATAAVTAR